jgi:hypothetical protein
MRLCQKTFENFKYLHFLISGIAETPKSPKGDFKAAPLGEVWRGKAKTCLQIVSLKN